MARGDFTARLRSHQAAFVRGAGFVVAAAVVCGALAVGSVLRAPPSAPSPPALAAAEEDAKDQARVGAGTRQVTAQATPSIANVSIWHPGKIESAPAETHETGPSVAPSNTEPQAEWREQTFTFVEIVDGRTFISGGVTLRLAGLDLPPPDQVCRTLDSRLEQCVTRAATQLELLTRSRTLACRYRMTTSSEATGSCRIGSGDLAERMVRTGFVRAADPGRAVVASAAP